MEDERLALVVLTRGRTNGLATQAIDVDGGLTGDCMSMMVSA